MDTYFIEELDIADLDALMDKGVCFDVCSKAAVLPVDNGSCESDEIWDDRG